MRQQKFYANTLTRFFTSYVWSWALPFTGLFCVFLCLLSSTKASAPTTTTYPYNYMYGTVAVCIAQNWTLTDWLTDWLIDWLIVCGQSSTAGASSTKPVPVPPKKNKNAIGVQRKLTNITDELPSVPAVRMSTNQPAEAKGSVKKL